MDANEERDVCEVFPLRQIECSEIDLEVAIGILEGILERPDQIEGTMMAHLSVPEAKELYIKAFTLAAESMKGKLRVSDSEVYGHPKVLPERTIRFF